MKICFHGAYNAEILCSYSMLQNWRRANVVPVLFPRTVPKGYQDYHAW